MMLSLFFTLSVSLMIGLPVVLAALLRRRLPAPWLLFFAGMATFIASQVVHFPLNQWLSDLGLLTKTGAANARPLWQNAVVLGLTAGLCEELARAGGYAVLRRFRTFGDGLMMGLGHGGIESIFFGGVLTAGTVGALLPLRGADLHALISSPEQLAAVELQMRYLLTSPWLAFAPALERLLAMGLHVTLSIMVWRAFQKRNALYVVIAIVFHAFVDAAAVLAASQTALGAWEHEGLLILTALPGYLWLGWTFYREGAAPARSLTPLAHEAAVFWAAMHKELLQQWRTRRVLIVAAVFALFGLASPVVAYFTPQMLKAIPGAEQFASLVPTPTAADAMVQYVKNLTQFGFILALLLGMGAVAGEKERGTASLVLSKPMTRWAFVASKFAAQLLVYGLGFALALAGGYFYTQVIFGAVAFGPFAMLNLVLFFWLLPFVAVTLLGSVIGNSTGAAAGIGLGGVVVLLIASNLPLISSLMPGALVGWASQLGIQAVGGLTAIGQTAAPAYSPLATGALAASAAITLICVLASVALFEQQEL